jgi:hypothetical protein
MKKLALTAVLLFTLAGAAFGDSYRVTYTRRGLIERITIQAESSQEARRVVMAILPGAVVTGAYRVK